MLATPTRNNAVKANGGSIGTKVNVTTKNGVAIFDLQRVPERQARGIYKLGWRLCKIGAKRRELNRLHGGRLGHLKDLRHTVKSHSVASSGTNSGYIDSNGSVVWGA
jgi:hypothetical protein